MPPKAVLAYSGGLDTSVCIPWMKENYGVEVIAVSLDIGEERDYEGIRKKAEKIGAIKAVVIDAKKEFAEDFILPALKANALYEGKYPLATALGRPLIAKHVIAVAQAEKAEMVAHGSTGKGNDQVRFEVAFATLAPELKPLAPIREWKMTREAEIEYAKQKDVPVPVDLKRPYSIDVNLWGRSIEAGVLEDPNVEPTEDAFAWTKSPAEAPNKPTYIEIEFESGKPVAINGEKLDFVEIISRLNQIGGENGIGRIDVIENRLVGIKSREVYEAPAATILIEAHRDLERLTLDRETLHYKQLLEPKFAELVYYGLWFSPLREHLQAFFDSTQKYVTGAVKLKLLKGSATVVGRSSPYSQYNVKLATYEAGDLFDHAAAEGFIKIWGLPSKVAKSVEESKGE